MQGVLGTNSKPYLYLYHKFYKRTRFPSVDHLIETFAQQKPEAFFVQIGVNDGSTEDPIHRHIILGKWAGILVEPLEEEFTKLKKQHKNNPRLIFENVAIADKRGKRPFFFIDKLKNDVPYWVSKLSSFDPTIPAQVKELYPHAVVSSKDIDCMTVNDLLEKNKVNHVDLLLTDTEGFDFEILKTVDWSRINPEIVVFEHRHLDPSDMAAALKMLQDQGYAIFKDEYDTVGIKNEKIKHLYQDHLERE